VRRAGGVWPGTNELLRKLGCGKQTLYDAISASPYLSARRSDWKAAQTRSPRIQLFAPQVLDRSASTERQETVEELVAEQEADRAESARFARPKFGKRR
jgi:hypothetical protein